MSLLGCDFLQISVYLYCSIILVTEHQNRMRSESPVKVKVSEVKPDLDILLHGVVHVSADQTPAGSS
jgi:hypothetical protein